MNHNILAKKSSARLFAAQAVYQMLVMNQNAQSVIEDYVENRIGIDEEMLDLVTPDGVLFAKIVTGVGARMDDVRALVSGHLNNNKDTVFTAEPILGATLLCGAYELLAHVDIDAPIIISDYVDVAKSFFDMAEPKIVNGVLDSVAKTVRPA